MKPLNSLISAIGLCLVPSLASAAMTVTLEAPWDGKKIPAGQHCPLFGGKGGTPPMAISGLPKGTAWVVVAFNDRDYAPLSRNGGHGTIGFPVKGTSAKLPAVPGMTDKLPGGARVLAKAKSTGEYASAGYLPPCSGGRGNRYHAEVSATGADGKVIETVRVEIGRY